MQGLTGMSKKDAQASYKDFKKEAGGEKIKLDKFTKLVNSMNTNKGLVIYIYNFTQPPNTVARSERKR